MLDVVPETVAMIQITIKFTENRLISVSAVDNHPFLANAGNTWATQSSMMEANHDSSSSPTSSPKLPRLSRSSGLSQPADRASSLGGM